MVSSHRNARRFLGPIHSDVRVYACLLEWTQLLVQRKDHYLLAPHQQRSPRTHSSQTELYVRSSGQMQYIYIYIYIRVCMHMMAGNSRNSRAFSHLPVSHSANVTIKPAHNIPRAGLVIVLTRVWFRRRDVKRCARTACCITFC
jgi:hypothetical protein